jgi:hypothetical protein
MIADGYVGYELFQRLQWPFKPILVLMLVQNEPA